MEWLLVQEQQNHGFYKNRQISPIYFAFIMLSQHQVGMAHWQSRVLTTQQDDRACNLRDLLLVALKVKLKDLCMESSKRIISEYKWRKWLTQSQKAGNPNMICSFKYFAKIAAYDNKCIQSQFHNENQSAFNSNCIYTIIYFKCVVQSQDTIVGDCQHLDLIARIHFEEAKKTGSWRTYIQVSKLISSYENNQYFAFKIMSN